MSDELRERVADNILGELMSRKGIGHILGDISEDADVWREIKDAIVDRAFAEIQRTHAIVPLEPTAEMCECGPLLEQGSIIDSVPPITTSQADAVYRAMLRASPPQPPTRAGGEND